MLRRAVRSHTEWRRFVVALGSPEWASDMRFRTLYSRIRNRSELDTLIEAWTYQHDAGESMAILQKAGIAAGVVSNGADLCERDPQLQARGYWASLKLPDGSEAKFDGIPFKLSATPASVRQCTPEIGEHNDYVFGELLGLSRGERDDLAAGGAIWP